MLRRGGSRSNTLGKRSNRHHRLGKRLGSRRPAVEGLETRIALSALTLAATSHQDVDTTLSATELATMLVGPGVEVDEATFTGDDEAAGSFTFTDSTVVGFGQGIVLSSGRAEEAVGPNRSDSTSTDFTAPGDADLDALSGFPTFDAAVLEFDFVPTANQVVFYYAFASDEYPEWVNTSFNDVFAFFVNDVNYAVVRQTAGDPESPFVPVAVNNINNSNPVQDPPPPPMRADLFRANYYDPEGGPSVIDLELDGITEVLTFQAPVIPDETNHMKLAIADASDGVWDSAVFIQAGSLVSNDNPVADLSLSPSEGSAPLLVTAIVEGEDPNGLPLTYTIDWGDGTSSMGPLDQPVDDDEKTALVDHVYAFAGEYLVTLTVSNGSLSGTSVEDVDVSGSGPAQVIGRHLFYNQSFFDANNPAANAADDSAIDTSKNALLPGGTGSFENYSGYSRGLNGIMVDIAGSGDTLTAADFAFKVGNDNSPNSWAAGPAPTSVALRPGAGVGGSDRYTLIWPNNAVQKTWLQVTVLANANTNLAANDVFYFGNAVGDVGNTTANAIVSSADEALIRVNFTTGFGTAPVTSAYDIDKNRFVQTSDAALARVNQTSPFTALRLIAAPTGAAAGLGVASSASGAELDRVLSDFQTPLLETILSAGRRRKR
jgi:hypothetical protein